MEAGGSVHLIPLPDQLPGKLFSLDLILASAIRLINTAA